MADSTQYNQQSFAGSRPEDNGAGQRLQQDFSRIGTDLVGALGSRAEDIVNEQKSRAAGEIASLAGMVRNAANSIDQSNQGAVNEYAASMADEIERFAQRLRTSSWRVLASDLEGFGRRWPAMFMASSAALGFVLGRMLMTSGTGGSDGAGRETATAEPAIRPENAGIGGTLSGEGPAAGFGVPAGGETL